MREWRGQRVELRRGRARAIDGLLVAEPAPPCIARIAERVVLSSSQADSPRGVRRERDEQRGRKRKSRTGEKGRLEHVQSLHQEEWLWDMRLTGERQKTSLAAPACPQDLYV